MFEILVGRQKRIEISGRQMKELTVPLAAPTHCCDGANIVLGQQPGKRTGQ